MLLVQVLLFSCEQCILVFGDVQLSHNKVVFLENIVSFIGFDNCFAFPCLDESTLIINPSQWYCLINTPQGYCLIRTLQ